LKIAERLAALFAKTLFQNAYLQLRVLEFATLRCQLLLLLCNLPGSLIQLRPKLCNKLNKNRIGVRLGRGLWGCTHDASLVSDIFVDEIINRQCLCAIS